MNVIQIQMSPDGQLGVNSNVTNKVVVLGMLEFAKLALLSKMDEDAKTNGTKILEAPPGTRLPRLGT